MLFHIPCHDFLSARFPSENIALWMVNLRPLFLEVQIIFPHLNMLWMSYSLCYSYCNLDSQSLLEMGTKDLTFVQLNQLIGRKTGGISVYPLTSSVRGKEDPCCKIIVRGKSMAGRAEDLYDLVFLLFWNPAT